MKKLIWIAVICLIAFLLYRMGQIDSSSNVPLNNIITPQPTVEISPTIYISHTPIPTIDTSNEVTQYYYYCWDYGNPSPHHLGHHVYGDHYCTNGELRESGFTGY